MQRFLRRYLSLVLTFLFFGFCSLQVYGQPPLNQQIIKDKLSSGIDPNLLTPSQISSLMSDKNKVNQNQGADKNATVDFNNTKKEDTVSKSEKKVEVNSLERTYGDDVFLNSAVTDLTELSTPPLDYPIGVGDHIIVALWGGAEFQEDYIVARDGTIFPQGLGKLNVQGLTFENMRSMVYSRFRNAVPSSTNISVSLGQPRSIKVNVVGNVNKPGPITVSAFSNAFNVIAKAGGVTEYGNLRSIQIKRGGKLIDELDVYKYLTTGDFGKHIYLQNNDFVLITFVEKKVFATGQFKRPMYYQLKNNEGLKELLNFTGGLKSDALGSTIKVIRNEKEKQVQRDFTSASLMNTSTPDFRLEDGDVVKVENIRKGIINRIELQGEVNYPGV